MLRHAEPGSGADPGILALIAAGISGVTDCPRSAVFVLDGGGGALQGSAAHGFPAASVAALEADIGDVPLAAAAVAASAPVKCEEPSLERCLPRAWVDALGLAAAAFVPLVSGSEPVAVVLLDCAATPDDAWPDAERKARAYAGVAVAALERERPHERGAPAAEAAAPASRPQTDPPKLTEQELKVLGFAADGLTNPEIAARLGLSRHTVKEYLSHAMRKLEAANRIEAVRKASSLGLLDGTAAQPQPRRDEGHSHVVHVDGQPPVEASDLKVPPIKLGRLLDARER